jgi:hypothetical protein
VFQAGEGRLLDSAAPYRQTAVSSSEPHTLHGRHVEAAVVAESSSAYSRSMRKVPDTWWGAVVVGVLTGAVGGVTAALLSAIWSSDSVAHLLFVSVPAFMAGGVVFFLLLRAHEMRRPRRHV